MISTIKKHFLKHQIHKEHDLIQAALNAFFAWEKYNNEKRKPDLSNHYTSAKASTEFAHAMLRLGNVLRHKNSEFAQYLKNEFEI